MQVNMYMYTFFKISRYLLFEGVQEREGREYGKATPAHPQAQSEEAVVEEEEEGLLEAEGAQEEVVITGGIGLQMPLQTGRDNLR